MTRPRCGGLLDDHDHVARADRLAGGYLDLRDRAGLTRGADGHGRADLRLRHPYGHAEPAAVDLDVDVAPHLRLGIRALGVVAGRVDAPTGADGPGSDGGQVEALLDPFRRVLAGHKVGVAEDGQVGRDRGGDAGYLELLERPNRAGDR